MIYKCGQKVEVICIKDIPRPESRPCEGTIATIRVVRGPGSSYHYSIEGIDKDGEAYHWGVKESWIKSISLGANKLGEFKKALVHRKLAADPETDSTWTPTPEW